MRNGVALLAAMMVLSGCITGANRMPFVTSGKPGSNGTVTASIIASMNGGLVGGSIGSKLDDDDRRLALEAEYKALEYTPAGQSVKWQGEDRKHGGDVVAAQPYRVGSQDCRQYAHTVTADGQTQTARGTACRNGDGSWTPLV